MNNFHYYKKEKYFASLFLLYLCHHVLNLLTFVVGVLYIIVGIFVIITKSFGVKLEPTPANVLGFLLSIYGVFRLVRAFIRLRKERRDEE